MAQSRRRLPGSSQAQVGTMPTAQVIAQVTAQVGGQVTGQVALPSEPHSSPSVG
jgi:hypothetical protein